MKKNYRYDKLLYTVCCLLLVCCNAPTQQESTTDNKSFTYYCPMHPEVEQNQPGTCDKCGGMTLVLKDSEGLLDAAILPTSSNVISKVHIINPVYKKLPVEISSLGYLDYDNNSKADISSRYTGRIEKLYIKYNFQKIKKGDPVFEIYSPDLVTAAENLLFLIKTSPEEKELLNAARQKLILLQLTAEQIKEIETSGKVKNSITVYSKYDGHVHEAKTEMDENTMNTYAQTPLLSVREGMYVERGMILFNVLNTQNLVVMLKIKSADIGKVYKSQDVSFYINGDSSDSMTGKVDFIEPVFNINSKSMMVRVNLNNQTHNLKVGSLVNAKIISDSLETLWIPITAVVDLGKDKIVWKWNDGHFKATKIETGIKINNWIEITDGLTEADQIA